MTVASASKLSISLAHSAASAAALLRCMRYEIIPLKSAGDCIRFLPPQSVVSVTCSPSSGIGATQKLCETLLTLGHTPIPHLAARCVDGPSHTAELASWVRSCRLKEVFIVGGDAPQARSYTHALPFMSDFLSAKVPPSPRPPPPPPPPPLSTAHHPLTLAPPCLQPHVDFVSFAAYPATHPSASTAALAHSLLSKQSLLLSHGIRGSAVTQMCFDVSAIKAWALASRSQGFTMPIILGVPGPAPIHKLLAVAARIGVGESLRFMSRGGAEVAAAIAGARANGRYDAADIIRQLSGGDLEGIHCFTFNAVEDAVDWARAMAMQADVAAGDDAR